MADTEHEAAVRTYVVEQAKFRLAHGEPLTGWVKLVYVRRGLEDGTTEETGPYLLPSAALTLEEKEAKDPYGRYYTLWDLSQGGFRV